MARRAAWESVGDADLGPYAKRKSGRWGRVFVGVLLIGTATFAAAYYLPLYRAHQTLTAEFQKLSRDSQTAAATLRTTQSDLKASSERLDKLQGEHDQREHDQKADTDKLGNLKSDLSAKLEKLLKKGSANLLSGNGHLVVSLDDALLFAPQKLDVTAPGKAALCDVAKLATTAGATLRINAFLSEAGSVPVPLQATFASPWSYTAARAAAVAQTLEEKCAVSGSRLIATGDGKRDPFARIRPPSASPANETTDLELFFER